MYLIELRYNQVNQSMLASALIVNKSASHSTQNTIGGTVIVKTATEVGVRAIQDHKVIEWNTCWKCRLSEGSNDK